MLVCKKCGGWVDRNRDNMVEYFRCLGCGNYSEVDLKIVPNSKIRNRKRIRYVGNMTLGESNREMSMK